MDDASTIPKFVVDLSLPPENRYNHIIPHFRGSVTECNLPSLFDELLETIAGPRYGKALAAVARYTLRRVHSAEETAELAGISRAIGIPMHILVAFNVLLDLLLGCTSGGVRTLFTGATGKSTRILHFRTLDWGMEQLRQIIVELDFVRFTGGPVIATTSISSTLRKFLLDPFSDPGQQSEKPQEINTISPDSVSDQYVENILTRLSTSNSTAAYLIFCQPNRIYIVEKDHKSASIRESDTFLTAYNHDVKDEEDPSRLQEAVAALAEGEDATGMADLVGLSLTRKDHLQRHWRKRVRACQRRYKQRDDVVTMSDVIGFLEHEEISNPETHYAVIMDPEEGKVIWRRQYEVESESGSEDLSSISEGV
ncbi:beta subunit of N-acylethanolamine-hydrolyzing acid amidase-domain-containing protein [Fusarium acuminatum]|uniref:ceramidase n=1 Tax=Fusarium acuminatum TaxID=5515 RepID=A0ABZ2X688_9HYPO